MTLIHFVVLSLDLLLFNKLYTFETAVSGSSISGFYHAVILAGKSPTNQDQKRLHCVLFFIYPGIISLLRPHDGSAGPDHNLKDHELIPTETVRQSLD